MTLPYASVVNSQLGLHELWRREVYLGVSTVKDIPGSCKVRFHNTGHARFLSNEFVAGVGGEFILERSWDFLGALDPAGFLGMTGFTAVGVGAL